MMPSKRALAFAISLGLGACNPQPQHAVRASNAPATATPAGLPPLKITGYSSARNPVRIVEESANRKVYVLVARSYVSRSSQSAAQATFQESDVTFYARDGTTLRARAPVAVVDERRKAVVLTGGVHAVGSGGSTLTCDRLTYDRGTGLLNGEGNVRITGMQGGSQQVLTGNSFTSDVTLTQMKMQ